MPKSKKEGILLSVIMSLIMIYIMAALNNNVKLGEFSVSSWILALKRLPLGLIFGLICDLCICTPISRKIVFLVAKENDREIYLVFILRFCMVIFMTLFMTLFSVIVSGQINLQGLKDFFIYLPYNFTIALPIQMLVVAPFSLRIARMITAFTDSSKVIE